jgi:hypothetical protein
MRAGAQAIDLLWTHTVATTPLFKVHDAILNFHKLKELEQNSDHARRVYKKEQCLNRSLIAKRVVNNSLNLNLQIELSDETRYGDLSLRQLVNGVEQEQIQSIHWSAAEASNFLHSFMKFVWQRSGLEGVRPDRQYPGKHLRKPYFKNKSGGFDSSTCAVAPNGGVPVVKRVPVRTDMTVEFEDAPDWTKQPSVMT